MCRSVRYQHDLSLDDLVLQIENNIYFEKIKLELTTSI